MATIIQLRNDTAANFTQYNPTLAEGECGLELDTRKIKVGDGIHRWTELPYWTDASLIEKAVKYNGSTAVGSATQGVYVAADGTATAMTYELNKTVPSDAVFTDDSAIWGNITGTLSNQTDLQGALDNKVDKTTTADKVYGTDAQGNQTTYDKNSFGQVDDVTVGGTSVVTNKVAALGSMASETASDYVLVNNIVNDVVSTDTNKPLSANMGKELQDQVDNLKARGRFLALWDCSTGLAETHPTVSPYEYKAGDYFIVGVVAQEGGANYKPSGSSYTDNVPSTAVETNDVSVDDVYYYDGSTWHLQVNTQKEIAFVNVAGDPYDNSNLASALNDKQNTISDLATIRSGAEAGATALQGVQLNGTDLTPDANQKVNVPILSSNQFGVAKISSTFGTGVQATTGYISLVKATDAEIEAKTQSYKPIVPNNLDKAVKVGITTNTNTLTDTEKQNACSWIGAASSAQGALADSALQGVQLNGTDLTPDANSKVNIPYADTSRFGVVKLLSGGGIAFNNNQQIYIYKAVDTDIDAKTNTYRPIVPANLDKAVKTGVTTNTLTLTDEEKTNAQNWLGVTPSKTIFRKF